MKKTYFLLLCTFSYLIAASQPKLVVGIVVDQMRYDYIQKYWNKFGDGGFKRLVNEGYNCKNTNYNYVPTFTGPGHSAIFTGTTPAVSGIVSNDWYDRSAGKKMYCTDDKTASTVGSSSSAGKMSPANLLVSTVGEELRKSNKNASKVIGIALKDRGAILPAGHTPTAAFWFDAGSGNWISSTYYMNELPVWVNVFNKNGYVKKYLSQTWNTLLPLEQYSESDADDNNCEEPFKGKERPVFPYDLAALMKSNGELGLIRSTPQGNSFTRDFAIAAVKNEMLGKNSSTDFLTVSFSSPDYIGHQFGPQSVEVEDCYLRLDMDIDIFLKFLNTWLGKDNVLVFLTSDHGASEAVTCLQKRNSPSGILTEKAISDSLKKFLKNTYNDTIRLMVNDFDVYFDRNAIAQKKMDLQKIQQQSAGYLAGLNGIAAAYAATEIQGNEFAVPGDSIRSRVKAGHYAERSGDVTFVLKPGWLQGYEKGGTSHGSPYWYDTHVPLLWWGYTVKPGSTEEGIAITQIAPTVSELMKVPVPSGCTSKAIQLGK